MQFISFSSALQRYAIFLMLFLGAGFVAGSVVHFGEGVTLWDSLVLAFGVFLFIGGSLWQEVLNEGGLHSLREVMHVIISSLFLSLTVGMASGGTQHFIDTPHYSSWLIPLGLTVGFVAFLFKYKHSLSLRAYCPIFASLLAVGIGLHFALQWGNRLLPDSVRVGHGSHAGSSVTPAGEEMHGDTHIDKGEHVQDSH